MTHLILITPNFLNIFAYQERMSHSHYLLTVAFLFSRYSTNGRRTQKHKQRRHKTSSISFYPLRAPFNISKNRANAPEVPG